MRGATIDLLLGDLRRLPFADGTFTKAYSLDVLEHLSPEALRGMLAEATRVLAPGGALFVYTHVRKNAPIAVGLRWINALARRLERGGLIDLRQERLRKSDHLNPLATSRSSRRSSTTAGFRIERIRYYTPLVGGFVENILMRMAERAMARRRGRARLAGAPVSPRSSGSGIREARTDREGPHRESPATYAALRGLSFAMKLDLLLFGRVRSGPFFALLRKPSLTVPNRTRRHEDPLLRHRSDRARHHWGIGPRRRRSRRGWRRSATTCTCWRPGRRPFPRVARRVDPDAAAARRTHLRWAAPAR